MFPELVPSAGMLRANRPVGLRAVKHEWLPAEVEELYPNVGDGMR